MSTISDGKARRIAAEWHSGQTCPILSFATTGMIDDLVQEAVEREITHLEKVRPQDTPTGDFAADHRASLRDLRALAAYLEHAGHRTPVVGWASVWE